MSFPLGNRLLHFADRFAMRAKGGDAEQLVSERISIRQVAILDGTVPSAAANIPATFVIAWVLRDVIELWQLGLWIGAMIAAVCALGLSVRSHAHEAQTPASMQGRLHEHTAFATLIGFLWGGFIFHFGPVLDFWHMLILTLTIMGCATACIPALGSYLPAFYGFFVMALAPLAYANFTHPTSNAVNIALLIVLYAVTVAGTARAYHRSILSALQLQVKNELLADKLLIADAATAAATKSKWESFAHLSHELRTPMNAVLGFSDIMRQQMFGLLGPRYLDYAGSIHESGERALSLIDSILEVSRAEAGQLTLSETEIELAGLIAECLRMHGDEAAAKRLWIGSDLPATGVLVLADRPKLTRAVLNVIANAVKYTGGSGSVFVSLLRPASGGIDIVVTDTGIGIASGDIARCQEPFIRLGDPLISDVHGAGLGLPIARLFIVAHGGVLTIKSALGEGTTVTIHLPPERCARAVKKLPPFPRSARA